MNENQLYNIMRKLPKEEAELVQMAAQGAAYYNQVRLSNKIIKQDYNELLKKFYTLQDSIKRYREFLTDALKVADDPIAQDCYKKSLDAFEELVEGRKLNDH